MENHKEELAQNGFKTLQREFLVIGKTRVKSWQAWLLIGVAAGLTAGVLFVANRSGELEAVGAQETSSQPREVEVVIAQSARSAVPLGNREVFMSHAQSFILSGYGDSSATLDKVSIALSRQGANPTFPIKISVRETLEGNDLVSTNILPAVLSSKFKDPTWVDVIFPAPLAVTQGKTYFLFLSVEKVDRQNFYQWSVSWSNPYAAGTFYDRGKTALGSRDALTKIHLVATPPLPSPPPPPPPVVTPGVKSYVFKFYIEPALIPDREFAKRALVQYVQDMNTILAKNTTIRLSFDPETGIIEAATKPYTCCYIGLPMQDFEIWAYVKFLSPSAALGKLGTAHSDKSGAEVIEIKLARLFDPSQLVDNSQNLKYYWDLQINTALHELAHAFGAGIGEYYSIQAANDPTGEEPLLNMQWADRFDPYWGNKQDYIYDPLINPVLGQVSRAEFIDKTRFSELTAAFFNSQGRLGNGQVGDDEVVPDLTRVRVRILEKSTGQPIVNARVKIWNIAVRNSPAEFTKMLVDNTTNDSGEIIFDWKDGARNRHVRNMLKLIKAYKDGFYPSAVYVSDIIDAQEAKVLRGKNEFVITLYMANVAEKPSLSMLSPNGGEEWQTPSTHNIRWAGATPDSDNVNVSLELVRLDGTVVENSLLPRNVLNDGKETWAIPNIEPGAYRMRIRCVSNCTLLKNESDESDATFKIVPAEPSLTIIAPGGGEKWVRGSKQSIRWSSTYITRGYPIEAIQLIDVSNPENTYILISNTVHDGIESITVPETVPPGTYRVEIKTTWKGKVISGVSNTISVGGLIFDRLKLESGVFPAGEELSFVVSASTAYDEAVELSVYPIPEGARLLPIGDVTMNGLVSALDGNQINQYLAGSRIFTPAQQLLADINLDGQISKEDANLALQIAVELAKPKPAVVFIWTPTTAQIGTQSLAFIASGAVTKDTAEIRLQLKIESVSSLNLLSPNGGEEWLLSSTQTLTWSGTTTEKENVLVSFLLMVTDDAGVVGSLLPQRTPNDGAETWVLPTASNKAGQYRVSIVCVQNCALLKNTRDNSDAPFRITSP